jgi:hypothetical protein
MAPMPTMSERGIFSVPKMFICVSRVPLQPCPLPSPPPREDAQGREQEADGEMRSSGPLPCAALRAGEG